MARNKAKAASYPDVSLDARAKEGGKEYPSHGPLRCITSHSFRACLCHAKNEAPEEEAEAKVKRLYSQAEHRLISKVGSCAFLIFLKRTERKELV